MYFGLLNPRTRQKVKFAAEQWSRMGYRVNNWTSPRYTIMIHLLLLYGKLYQNPFKLDNAKKLNHSCIQHFWIDSSSTFGNQRKQVKTTAHIVTIVGVLYIQSHD